MCVNAKIEIDFSYEPGEEQVLVRVGFHWRKFLVGYYYRVTSGDAEQWVFKEFMSPLDEEINPTERVTAASEDELREKIQKRWKNG